MKVALGSDHAGFNLKEEIRRYLAGTDVEVIDEGTNSGESVDYPDYAERVALAVSRGQADRGILVCGTGIGVCISANKIHGIRAAQAWNSEIARLSRQHNDANVLCLSGRFMKPEAAFDAVKVWLETSFEGGRHQRRLDKISELEKHG
jgi:ribose 5-phosphate isomerase B